MPRVVLRSAAEAEVADAVGWYAERSRDIAARFLLALDEALALVADNPAAFPMVRPPLRRCLLSHFPYAVYYRVYSEYVSVVAVVHGRRHPRRWQSRA